MFGLTTEQEKQLKPYYKKIDELVEELIADDITGLNTQKALKAALRYIGVKATQDCKMYPQQCEYEKRINGCKGCPSKDAFSEILFIMETKHEVS